MNAYVLAKGMKNEFPAVSMIKEDPDLFRQWLINNNGLEILNEGCRVFSPEKGNYYLCDYFGGQLWLCYADEKKHTYGTITKLHQAVLQISGDMRQDFGDCFNGCFYLREN